MRLQKTIDIKTISKLCLFVTVKSIQRLYNGTRFSSRHFQVLKNFFLCNGGNNFVHRKIPKKIILGQIYEIILSTQLKYNDNEVNKDHELDSLQYIIFKSDIAKVPTIFLQQAFNGLDFKNENETNIYTKSLILNLILISIIKILDYILKVVDSERSEECIDFTMMYVFFFVFFFASVYSITSRNNAPISNYGGGFRCKSKNLTFSNSFQKNREKQKKIDGKTGIFTQIQFSTESIFYMVVIQKLITTTEIFEFFFEVSFKFLRNLSKTRKFAILKIWYKVLHKFFFKYLVDKIFLALSKYLLTNHLRSESFFVYNDTYHCIQI
ncbi:hypothetical protein AGLY_006291 [Aphis glycines]|uniref:Uncharacterized protein n=1 Tax=Aphis glycines TaxID=307491 RepID=A0A6G0TRW5_APHGL|nr:hypothetical protein AGLY_006291 [Aphis glycines]